MAELHQYTCSCGHEVWADKRGYFQLMSGMIVQFRCRKCKDVVEMRVDQLNDGFPFIKCPECGGEQTLSTWNPVDGMCPKCEKEKMKEGGAVMMVD